MNKAQSKIIQNFIIELYCAYIQGINSVLLIDLPNQCITSK